MPTNTPPPGWPVGEPYEPYIPSGPSTPGTDYDKNPTKNWYPNGKYGWDDPYLNADAQTRKERYPHYWSYGDPDPEWRPSFYGETPPWNRNPNDKSGSANTQKGDWFGNTMRDKPKMSPEQRAWEKAEYAREDAERARAKQASRERTQQPSSSSGYPAQQGVSDMQTAPWNTNDSYSYGGGGQYGGPPMPSYGGGGMQGGERADRRGFGSYGFVNGDGTASGAMLRRPNPYPSGGPPPPMPSYGGGGMQGGEWADRRGFNSYGFENGDGTASGAMLRRPNPYPSGGPPPPMPSYGGGGQYGGPPMPSYGGGGMQGGEWADRRGFGSYGFENGVGPEVRARTRDYRPGIDGPARGNDMQGYGYRPMMEGGVPTGGGNPYQEQMKQQMQGMGGSDARGQDFGRIAQGFGQGGGAPMDFAQGFGGADMLRNMMGNRGGMGGGGNPFQNMMGGMAGMGRGNPFMSMMGGMGGGNPFQNMMGGMGGGGNPFQNMMGRYR